MFKRNICGYDFCYDYISGVATLFKGREPLLIDKRSGLSGSLEKAEKIIEKKVDMDTFNVYIANKKDTEEEQRLGDAVKNKPE